MNESKNFHEGHRERMLNRFLESSAGTSDHELLEILLYPLIPRKDTNLIAHRLLHAFGNLDKLFKASPKELMAVEGVGKRTACELIVIGKIMGRIMEIKQPCKRRLDSFFEIKKLVVERFSNLHEERFAMILLDAKFNEMLSVEFENKRLDNVSADMPEVATALALHKPKHVIIAHNHPSGNLKPSVSDDLTTQKLLLLCSLHGANLIDHVIVNGNNALSYYKDGRIDAIKEQIKSNVLFKDDNV